MKNQLEIERKYIIRMPDVSLMSKEKDYTADKIIQIYLESDTSTHRIRARYGKLGVVYTENEKVRVDRMSAIEKEREITENEFSELAIKRKDGTNPIEKLRHSFEYCDQIFEIDVYPQWKNTAIMETELENREKTVTMPPFIEIIKEVTGIKEYSNAAMSYRFPEETD